MVVYVEGGGKKDKTRSQCRRGFREFLAKILPSNRHPKIVACGSRQETFDRFRTALQNLPDFAILLVDSERPVTKNRSWLHLQEDPDHWAQPTGATDDQAHLMVQCMESWLLADSGALVSYYGQGFRSNALPGRPVEQISKQDVTKSLGAATRDTTKGAYHKTEHGFALLALIDPGKVRNASPHADRFMKVLET